MLVVGAALYLMVALYFRARFDAGWVAVVWPIAVLLMPFVLVHMYGKYHHDRVKQVEHLSRMQAKTQTEFEAETRLKQQGYLQ